MRRSETVKNIYDGSTDQKVGGSSPSQRAEDERPEMAAHLRFQARFLRDSGDRAGGRPRTRPNENPSLYRDRCARDGSSRTTAAVKRPGGGDMRLLDRCKHEGLRGQHRRCRVPAKLPWRPPDPVDPAQLGVLGVRFAHPLTILGRLARLGAGVDVGLLDPLANRTPRHSQVGPRSASQRQTCGPRRGPTAPAEPPVPSAAPCTADSSAEASSMT